MLKIIKYSTLFSLLVFFLASCDQESFDNLDETVIEGEPVFEEPELTISVKDTEGNSIPEALLHIYFDGEKQTTVETDINGEVSSELTVDMDGIKKTLLFCEKENFNDNAVRIDTEDIELGRIDVILNSQETFLGTGNVQGMLSSDVILLDGYVSNAVGNPGAAIIVVFEEALITQGDTTVFMHYVPTVNGNYEILVPANTDLYISILEFNNCTADLLTSINQEDLSLGDDLYAEFIGAFANDTTLPTNTNAGQSTGESFSFDVTGRILDCNGVPLGNEEVILAQYNFTGYDTLAVVNTSASGAFNSNVTVCGTGINSIAALIMPDGSNGLPPTAVSLDYDSNTTLADFGDIEICPKEFLFLTDGTNIIDEDNFITKNVDEAAGIIEVALISFSTMRGYILTIKKDNSGDWYGDSFEATDGTDILYSNTGDYDVQVTEINGGQSLSCAISNLEVQILEPFPVTNTLNGTLVINK